MLTQIYEIAPPAEAEAISAIGVDHIGVLVGDGTLSAVALLVARGFGFAHRARDF